MSDHGKYKTATAHHRTELGKGTRKEELGSRTFNLLSDFSVLVKYSHTSSHHHKSFADFYILYLAAYAFHDMPKARHQIA